MGEIEQRLTRLGLQLPRSPEPPPGFRFSFSWVRLSGNRAFCQATAHLRPMGRQSARSARSRAKCRSNKPKSPLAGRRWPCSAASNTRSVISIESPPG